ncbi:hypothetical protein E2C01_078021 [Portunus trituberculatus]|uniref:Uncharacterized protein n=1 Tax=Portunus trituberculatus TaxID=210409 RepID=A0A5B7IT09_PORTR|nr:hypothetical protein [Portunus trituberculatus]
MHISITSFVILSSLHHHHHHHHHYHRLAPSATSHTLPFSKQEKAQSATLRSVSRGSPAATSDWKVD